VMTKSHGQSGTKRSTLLEIVGMGMRTAVGSSAQQTYASLRAGISGIRELNWAKDRNVDPVLGGAVDYLTDEMQGVARLFVMAAPAMQEAFRQVLSTDEMARSSRWAIFLLTGKWETNLKPPPLVSGTFCEAHLAKLQRQTGLPVDARWSLGTGGQAEIYFALENAWNLIDSGQVDYVMVGGVDSLLQFEVLYDLDLRLRLKTAYQSEGFIPGEAAAFLVFRAYKATFEKGSGTATIAGLGTALEKNTHDSDEPCFGEGLSKALRSTFRHHESVIAELDGVVCDLDGERYRAKEWALSYSRILGTCPGNPPLWCPAESIGNVGAALGPICLGWAAAALEKGYAPGPCLLIWGSSDQGQRGAVFMVDPVRFPVRRE